MSFPLHARYAHPDAGWEADQKNAAAVLTPGEVYTIRQLTVGRSSSYLTFQEIPGEFNAVLFDAVGGWQEELDEALAPVTAVERLRRMPPRDPDNDHRFDSAGVDGYEL